MDECQIISKVNNIQIQNMIACEFDSTQPLGLTLDDSSGRILICKLIPGGQAARRNATILQHQRKRGKRFLLKPGDCIFSKNGKSINSLAMLNAPPPYYRHASNSIELLMKRPGYQSNPEQVKTCFAGEHGKFKSEVLVGNRLRVEILFEHPQDGDTLLPVFEGRGEGSTYSNKRWNYIPVTGRGQCFSVRVTDLGK